MYPATTEKFHFTKEQILDEESEIRNAINDISRFSVLYDRYYARLLRFVYHRIDSDNNAADLTSQIFLIAMLNLKNYRFKGVPFASWLFRIAANEIVMEYRYNRCNRVFNTTSEHLNQIAFELDEEVDDEKVHWLQQTLSTLKVREMELIELRYFEKRSFSEISDITGMKENNVKVKIHRIIEKLKRKSH
jgi:RNA polymerase sigma-70 factor, ECF subfamily